MAEKSCSSTGCTKESCAGCPSAKGAQKPQSMLAPANPKSHIYKVIVVISGKCFFVKSLVTASLATLMKEPGYSVGILDADITGPSIPKMYGLHGPAEMDGDYIKPVVTENGIPVMSINLLLPDEESPVIWRGPVISGMVKQFWTDVIWGELDYLFVDMPPGTGDVPLTVFQSLPLDGIVIVSSPQDLVQMIVKKAYHMAKSMNVPILGIVENYSYLVCPDFGKKIFVFGERHIDEIASKMDLKVLGKMPIDPSLAELSDKGDFAKAENKYLTDVFEVLHQLDRVKKEEE